jgi:hypothetical protein
MSTDIGNDIREIIHDIKYIKKSIKYIEESMRDIKENKENNGIIEIPVYIVSYKNKERRQRMIERFHSLSFKNITFVKEVENDDERLSNYNDDEKGINKRIWSIMLQHLDSIRHFYENSDSDIAIFCEDDIHISNTLNDDLPNIIDDFNTLNLDVLMLGYLLPFKIEMNSWYFPIIHKNDTHTYHRYPNDIWGTQMHLISKSYAKELLDKYTVSFAYENKDSVPYNPDWIITKNGNRALIYPMIAVEEGVNLSDCESQQSFHKRCFEMNYIKEKYI